MIDRRWLGDLGLAVLLVLPTAALMWPSASTPQLSRVQERQTLNAAAADLTPIDQRSGAGR